MSAPYRYNIAKECGLNTLHKTIKCHKQSHEFINAKLITFWYKSE